MPSNPKNLEALSRLLSDNPMLAFGWAGREIAEQVPHTPKEVISRHRNRFAAFRARLKRKLGHLCDVQQLVVFQHIEAWSWWACGFRGIVPEWWEKKLDEHDRDILMEETAPLLREKSVFRIPLLRLMQNSGEIIFQKSGNSEL